MSLNFTGTTATGASASMNPAVGGGINLSKTVQAGQRINLSKEVGQHVSKYAVGIEWRPKPGIECDCDVSILLLDANDRPIGPVSQCMCFYQNLELPGVKSYGDNRDGDNSAFQTPTGCDEQVDIDLAMLNPAAVKVMIIATTHSETNGQPGTPLLFGKVGSPVLKVFDNTNGAAPVERYNFELDEEYSMSTAVDVAAFYKKNGEWRYVSMNDEVGTHAFGLQAIVDKFQLQG